MNAYVDRKTHGTLKTRGVIAHTRSRLPDIFSFLLTGALFAAALLLTFSHAFADGHDEGRCYDGYAQCSSADRDA